MNLPKYHPYIRIGGTCIYVHNSLKIATINLMIRILKPVQFVLTWPLLEYVFYLYIDGLTVIMKYFWVNWS
jgi:hypothetical protein